MTPLSTVGWFVAVGTVVFILGGMRAHFQLSVTVYHIPLIVLLLLIVTGGLTGGIIAFNTVPEADKIDYRTSTARSDCGEFSGYSEPDDTDVTTQYRELSPTAQEIFRSALRADGIYTTNERPDDFRYRHESTLGENYIRYNADCYELNADPRGTGFEGDLTRLGNILSGTFLAVVVLFVAKRVSWERRSFKLPTAILVGLGSMGGLAVGGLLNQLAGAAVLIGLLTWVGLTGIERMMDGTFRERMEP